MDERGRGTQLARELGVPVSFVSKMASGERPIPIEHMVAIERLTSGFVNRRAMCPDRWAQVWPELEVIAARPAIESVAGGAHA